MRQAFNNVDWYGQDNVDNTLVGINLGFDFCAEHEHGVHGIRDMLGIPKDPTRELMGLDARKATKIPKDFIWFGTKSLTSRNPKNRIAVLVLHESVPWDSHRMEERYLGVGKKKAHSLTFWDSKTFTDKDIKVEWDERGFCIKVRGDENISKLKELHEAILRGDICVGIPVCKNPFDRGGLTVLIASRVPQEFVTKQLETDMDYFRLEDACKAAGLPEIEKTLKGQGKGWFCLAPSWAHPVLPDDYQEKQKRGEKVEAALRPSAHNIIFWLNPYDQNNNRWGWVTIEDLKDWIENKGRIPNHGRLQHPNG